MSKFCEDQSEIDAYPNGIIGEARKGPISIRCLQWGDHLQHGDQDIKFSSAQSMIEPANNSKHNLRVAFLPIVPDKNRKEELEDFGKLVEYFRIPSAVLTERMRSVGYAFGSKSFGDKTEIAWCHFLCRNVILKDDVIQDLGYLSYGNEDERMPRPSEMWTMCDFFLHVRPAKVAADGTPQRPVVTLLCFGAPRKVITRFKEQLDEAAWTEILEEPYLLFDIVYDELHALFDGAVAKMKRAVNPEEKAALERAGGEGLLEGSGSGDDGGNVRLNLQSLHNVQKNCIFMIEAAEASIATLDAMASKLKRSDRWREVDAIEYRKRTFHSTLLRCQSLDRRMSNVIQLSFNLITQADSTILKFDSKTMTLSASLTFAFLPLTGVATLFSTPFFDVDWEDGDPAGRIFRVSRTFWIFWCVVVPLTLFVVLSGAFVVNHMVLARFKSRWQKLFKSKKPEAASGKEEWEMA